MIVEILFFVFWISIEAALIWLIWKNVSKDEPDMPRPYGSSVIIRSQRVGNPDEPNFYKQ